MSFKIETLACVEQRRSEYIRLLRRSADPIAHRLANTLDGCEPERRCESAACPVCVRRFRKRLLKQLKPVYKREPHWIRASIIPANCLRPIGRLHGFDLAKAKKTWLKRLMRAPAILRNAILVGGVDVSVNVEENVIQGHQVHLYLAIAAPNSKKLRKAIRKTFAPELSAKRPYLVTDIEDFGPVFSYTMKPMFCRRLSYRNESGQRKGSDVSPLPSELEEILLWLAEYEIGDRQILRGLRRNGRFYQRTAR